MAQRQENAPSVEKKTKTPAATAVKVGHDTQPPVRQPLSRWPVPAWEREIDRWFDDFRRHFTLPRLWGPERWWPSTDVALLRMPAVDVYERPDEIVVKAEIPGLSKDEIEVNLTDSTLTLTGEKKKEEEVRDQDYYRCERAFGSFSRIIQLPSEVKSAEAKATFKDGVLEVRLPKSEAAKRKAVKVQVE